MRLVYVKMSEISYQFRESTTNDLIKFNHLLSIGDVTIVYDRYQNNSMLSMKSYYRHQALLSFTHKNIYSNLLI